MRAFRSFWWRCNCPAAAPTPSSVMGQRCGWWRISRRVWCGDSRVEFSGRLVLCDMCVHFLINKLELDVPSTSTKNEILRGLFFQFLVFKTTPQQTTNFRDPRRGGKIMRPLISSYFRVSKLGWTSRSVLSRETCERSVISPRNSKLCTSVPDRILRKRYSVSRMESAFPPPSGGLHPTARVGARRTTCVPPVPRRPRCVRRCRSQEPEFHRVRP